MNNNKCNREVKGRSAIDYKPAETNPCSVMIPITTF